MTITSTLLTISLTLNGNQPSPPPTGGDGTDWVTISHTAEDNGSSLQSGSGDPSALLTIFENVNNQITWSLNTESAGSPLSQTYILGIVVEAGQAGPASGPSYGGLNFSASSPAVYSRSMWAGPRGRNPRDHLSTDPYLLLAPTDNDFLLTVNTSDFFSNGNQPRTPPDGFNSNITWFSFNYRVYLYTINVGPWHVDPTFELQPASGPIP